MTRRALILVALASRLRADAADQAWEVMSGLATDLSSGNAVRFLTAFDPKMPGYEEFRVNVTALLAQGEVTSSIDLVSNEGDEQSRLVEVDWLLVLKRLPEGVVLSRREQRVKCKIEKQGKRWRIVSLSPAEFFTATG